MTSPLPRRLLSALCALALVLTLLPASASAAPEPAVSNNQNLNCYGGSRNNWSQPVRSYLCANASGGLTRVEYLGDGQIAAEDYSPSFQLQASRTIPFELSKWGGFFAGESYNFFLFGQNNPSESDSAEVIRVVKYSKDWQRLGQYSLLGGNIVHPFEAGSLRCAEYGGYLYIHTCREMYADSAGLNHQSSITLQLRESDMALVQYLDYGAGYVSHSFNQFILVDAERNVVMLDHGDGYPRAAVVQRPTVKAGAEPLDISSEDLWNGTVTESKIYEFPGSTGQNATGASLGGFAETGTGYVSAFCRDDEGSGWASRKVYLGYTHKSDLNSAWTLVDAEPTTSNPHLVPTGAEGGYILWNAMDDTRFYPGTTLRVAPYDTYGNVGTALTVEGAPLSDCAPVPYNGKYVWYTTSGSAPTFYALDESGVTATPANGAPTLLPARLFSDVTAAHWAYAAIKEAVDRGLAEGVGGGRFDPSGEMTAAQYSALLVRAFYEEPKEAGTPWYAPYRDLLARYFLYTNATCGTDEQITRPITRYNMAQLLYNVMKDKGAPIPGEAELASARGKIADWSSVPEQHREAVAACYALGLLTGMEDGCFHGEQTMNRAQGCTVLIRALAVLPQEGGGGAEAQRYWSAEEFCGEVFRLTNEARQARGLPALERSPGLDLAAQIRSEELSQSNGSTRPNGQACNTVLAQIGFTDNDLYWWGENRYNGALASPEAVEEDWEASPDLLERMCDANFTHMGVGLFRGEDGKSYCVQFFTQMTESNLTRYRAEILAGLNQLRAERGLPALQASEMLTLAAELRAKGMGAVAETVVHTDLRVTGMDMVMEQTYSGTVNTPEQVLSSARYYLTDGSPILDGTVTHAGIGFYRQANGQEVCVICLARVK